jgi:hypothetical protein
VGVHDTPSGLQDEQMARFPESTKYSLEQRLAARTSSRWPQLGVTSLRYRASFAYIDALLPDGSTQKLCRLRYVGSAHRWQFAIYRASHDDYQDSLYPTGQPAGTCEEALDTACGLYLSDPTAWT